MARTARSTRPRATIEKGLPLKARRHPLVAIIARQLKRCGVKGDLHGTPTKVVIGVSGGADSTALLLACVAIAARRDKSEAFIEPIAVHVHHHLRDSADADAQFVSDLCSRLGIELDVRHIDPGRRKGNVSANARALRYEALLDVANKGSAKFVAVAHHAEDQFETMLMALCRGTGLDGLSAMNDSRPLGDGVSLIRPLLGVRKAQCEDLCKAAGVKWRDDPSNTDVNRARARLRTDVLPVLEALWPECASRAGATAKAVAAAHGAFDEVVAKAFGDSSCTKWPRDCLRGLPPPLITAGLHRAAIAMNSRVSDALSQDHLIDAATAIADDVRPPRTFTWPGGLTLEVRARDVRLVHQGRRV